MIKIPRCFNCRHFQKRTQEQNVPPVYTCHAFPDGIPDDVMLARTIHDTPIPGQQGDYVFTPADQRSDAA